MQLTNRIAIITGASSGIGEAIARLFAAEGARVVLAARSEDKLRTLAASLGEGRALAVPTDVAETTQVERLVARAVDRFGGVDILVNNAGIGLYARVEEMDWEHFRHMWEVNFFGTVRLTIAALPHLKQRCGAVVNISSVAGKIPTPFMAGYCATKFALNALSDGLRMELKRAGVRVLTVCPGRVATGFHRNVFRDSENLPGVLRWREGKSAGISAERVARATVRALRWNQREIVVPWPLRLAVGFRTLFPSFTDRMLARTVR